MINGQILTMRSSFKMWAAHLYLRGPYFYPPSGTGTMVFQTNAPSGHSSAPLRETFGFTLFRSAQKTQHASLAQDRVFGEYCSLTLAQKPALQATHKRQQASLTFGTKPSVSDYCSLRSHQCQATAPFGASATNDKTQLGTRTTSATKPSVQ